MELNQTGANLAALMKRTIQIAENAGKTDIAELVSDALNKVEQNLVYIVVLGEFKRGKSTFINALLGDNILPTAVIPLTSVITKILYGKDKSVVVHYQNHVKKEVSLHQLDEYITERKNPENKKEVSYVEIYYPSEMLNGIVLVDTPGIGSVFQHNTLATYDFVPKVDAAIFLLTAEQPLGEDELKFITQLKDQVPKMFYVLNKADLISESDINDSYEFTKSVLKRYGDESNPKVFSVSAKNALEAKIKSDDNLLSESGFEPLEMAFSKLTGESKEKLLFESITTKMNNLVRQLRFQIQLEYSALKTPVSELETKIESFNVLTEKVTRRMNELNYLISGETGELVREIHSQLQSDMEEEQQGLRSTTVNNWVKNNRHLSNKELLESWSPFFYKYLQDYLENKKEYYQRVVNDRQKALVQRLNESASELMTQISQETAKIFEINLAEVPEGGDVQLDENFKFKVGGLKDVTLEDPNFIPREKKFIYGLLPGKPMRTLVLKELERIVHEQLERNYGRLKEETSRSITKTMKLYQEEIHSIKGIEAALDKALHDKGSKVDILNKQKSHLEERIKELDWVENQLNKEEFGA